MTTLSKLKQRAAAAAFFLIQYHSDRQERGRWQVAGGEHPCHLLATSLPVMAGVIIVTTAWLVKCGMKARQELACLTGGAEIKLLEND